MITDNRLNYGERRYGEMYSQAIDELGLEYAQLAQIKYVASQFESLCRHKHLSWTHHREVASVRGLSAGQRQAWLERAEELGLEYQSLANIKHVASTFEFSRRRENVPWSHHREVEFELSFRKDNLSWTHHREVASEFQMSCRHDNVSWNHRLDLRPSERWAMAQALRPYEEKAAKERLAAGQKAGGRGKKKLSGKLPESKRHEGESSSRLAGLVGCSRRTRTIGEACKR